MRRIIALSFIAVLAIAGCKKQTGQVSVVKTASYPIITITGPQYVSIMVGGAFTPPNATAYDTFYKEKPPVVVDLSGLDNTKPGLYTVVYSAKNSNGFVGKGVVYVAVTDISDTLDLSGWYIRTVSPANPNRAAFITKLGRGLFMTSNVGGVDTGDATTGAIVSGVFAAIDVNTIDFGSQPTSEGTLSASYTAVSYPPAVADTTIDYIIDLPGFSSTALRSFVKQP